MFFKFNEISDRDEFFFKKSQSCFKCNETFNSPPTQDKKTLAQLRPDLVGPSLGILNYNF